VFFVVVMFDGCCVIDGAGVTVATALPDEVPPLQLASLSDAIVYVVVAAGATLRVTDVALTFDWTTPSDQVTENGAVPVSVAEIVREVEGQPLLSPVTTAVGRGITVIAALPVDVPPLQFVSRTATIVYVVFDAGVTLRETVFALMFDCTRPSDHVTENGATPVRAALMVAEAPAQIEVVPETAAVGFAFTVTAVAADVAVQPFAVVIVTL
jgi:hypothetical protein